MATFIYNIIKIIWGKNLPSYSYLIFFHLLFSEFTLLPDWKKTIRHTAVRDTGVSPNYEGGNELPPTETPRTLQHYRIEEFEGAIKWSPIMPRGVNISSNRGYSFQPATNVQRDDSCRSITSAVVTLIPWPDNSSKLAPRRLD